MCLNFWISVFISCCAGVHYRVVSWDLLWVKYSGKALIIQECGENVTYQRKLLELVPSFSPHVILPPSLSFSLVSTRFTSTTTSTSKPPTVRRERSTPQAVSSETTGWVISGCSSCVRWTHKKCGIWKGEEPALTHFFVCVRSCSRW